ncbi:MAG: efflux RND transporter periplasmic adaptor subunit [Gammaproteobacteria bacterium]
MNNKINETKILPTVFFLLLISISFASQGAEKPRKVNTSAYKDIKVYVSHTLGGAVPAEQDSNLSAQISAIITAFHVDKGDEVKKDDVLVSLDCREKDLLLKRAAANLKAEKVQLAHALTQYNQAKKLNNQGNISKELYNQREAEENRLKATLENKKAARSLAQIKVDRCQIKAPFDGYITRRDASVGELTQTGTSLLHLVSKTNNVVDVKVNNRLLSSFTQGNNFRFVFNNKSYPLQIKSILPVLDAKTRNHLARLSFINERAVTGSVGKVIWQDAEASVPSDYIVSRDNKLGVLIAENDTAKFIEIKNAREGLTAKIELDDNVQIITRGRFNVKQGDTLLVNN